MATAWFSATTTLSAAATGRGAAGFTASPLKLTSAPARLTQLFRGSFTLAPLGRFSLVIASADTALSVASTVYVKVSVLVPDPPA